MDLAFLLYSSRSVIGARIGYFLLVVHDKRDERRSTIENMLFYLIGAMNIKHKQWTMIKNEERKNWIECQLKQSIANLIDICSFVTRNKEYSNKTISQKDSLLCCLNQSFHSTVKFTIGAIILQRNVKKKVKYFSTFTSHHLLNKTCRSNIHCCWSFSLLCCAQLLACQAMTVLQMNL